MTEEPPAPGFIDAEIALIQRAALHNEGCLAVSPFWNPETVATAVARLVALGIFEERPAKIGRPVWREKSWLEAWSLVLTPEGRALAETLLDAWNSDADPFALER